MPTFVFKAMDLAGMPARGEVDAVSKQAVADQLKARYNSATLEEAFFAASGHAFENGDGGGDN